MFAVFRNETDGVESRVVVLNDHRLSVTLCDIDVDEVLPIAKIFSPEDTEAAFDYAKKLVGYGPGITIIEEVRANG